MMWASRDWGGTGVRSRLRGEGAKKVESRPGRSRAWRMSRFGMVLVWMRWDGALGASIGRLDKVLAFFVGVGRSRVGYQGCRWKKQSWNVSPRGSWYCKGGRLWRPGVSGGS